MDAARYKDYILPLVFYKRMDDVYADEVARVGRTLGVDDGTAELYVEPQRKLVRFYLPHDTRSRTIRGRVEGLGKRITDNLRSIAHENPELLRGDQPAAILMRRRGTSGCWTTTRWRGW